MSHRRRPAGAAGPWLMLRILRLIVAAALALSAVFHVQLAPGYQQGAPGGIGQGTLFLVQAAAAVLAAGFVLLKSSRPAFAAAAVVGVGSVAAVILYRYVQVPAIGPLPSMFEPVWYPAKVITAVAEAAAGALALLGYAMVPKNRPGPRRRARHLHHGAAGPEPSP